MAEPELGRTFGRVADTYDRLRPAFAPEAIDRATAELGLGRGSVVLDLAAGTGRLTRPLRERFAQVLAVEPDDEMRAHLGGDARAGFAEAIPLDDDSVDAVFVGDAFPWFEPDQALAEIRRVARPGGGLGPESVVLDLGAGTGKLTRPLVERFPRVIAVEPDPGMRAVLTRDTEAYRVLGGKAEAIPLDDACVDAVLVGEAFHWFDTGPALEEIARVLRPGGGLGLIWKHWWETEPPVPAAASELMRRVHERPDLEPHALEDDADWRACFAASPFEELREETIESATLTVDGGDLVTLILTTSIFGSLPRDEHERAEAELRELIRGDYRLPIASGLYWTRLAE